MRHLLTRKIPLGSLFFGSLLVLQACPDNPPSTTIDQGKADMADMLDMLDMSVDDPSCTSDEECTGSFEGFFCIQDVCTECAKGEEGCVCRANGTCKTGFQCGEDGLCAPCESGTLDCPCHDDETCNEGLSCSAEVCVPDTCTPGALDCPCDADGACPESGDDTYCDEQSVCRFCSSDIEGCPCDADDTCRGDNYCSDDQICLTCSDFDKEENCVCENDSECAVGLVCDDEANRCREKKSCADVCLPFQLCDDSGAGDPMCISEMCVDGYTYEDGQCVAIAGNTCDGRDGSTNIQASCEANNQECVENSQGMASCVDTCTTLSATCEADNRDCDIALLITEDAVCGSCKPGYEDDGAGTCIVSTEANCSTFGAADSIAQACEDRNQICVERATGGAYCGECLEGYEFDANKNACVEKALCGGEFCDADEFCYFAQDGSPPVCADVQCGDNQAYDVENDACISCSVTCDQEGVYPITIDGSCSCASDVFCSFNTDGASDRCFERVCPEGQVLPPGGSTVNDCITCGVICGTKEGERARQWPVAKIDSSCFCEVQEGYAAPFGGSGSPQKCDADGDGWINRTSDSVYQTAALANDQSVLGNFRCERRQIDRFILQNEIGQRRAVSLCGDDLIDYEPSTVPTCTDPDGLVAITLSEEDDIDSDDAILLDSNTYPAFGTRAFKAAELNSLTKGCVSANGDLNANGTEDVAEEHAIKRDRLTSVTFSTDERFAFHSMSYFLELHKGFYEPSARPGNLGAYVIAERSRCDADFTMGYSSGGTYTQQCTRSRRQDYDFANSHNGFDFAHWGCDAANGTCQLSGPLVDASLDDLDGDNLPDHGICDYTDVPDDSDWRGMTHHSQFQCVVLKTSADPAHNYELAIDQVYKSGEAAPSPNDFNACQAVSCNGVMGCDESATQGVYQPDVTQYLCSTRERDAVTPEEVGWISIRYVPDSVPSRPYIRGCIDESYGTDGTDHFKDLCPGYSDNPDAVLAAGNPGDAGKLICSCNRFFGGSNCEYTCQSRTYANPSGGTSTSYLHVGDRDRGYDDATKADYACGTDDNFCSLHPPVENGGGLEFAGGRRGYWMCGEFTLTRTLDDNLADISVLEASATIDNVNVTYEVDGKISTSPIKRELLEQDPTCVSNCYSAF